MPDPITPDKTGIGIPRWLKLAVGAGIVVIAFYFLLSRLIRDWHSIPFDKLHFSPVYLVLSFAILILCHFPLAGVAWKTILAGLGERISLKDSIAILSVTQVGKYIPGKLWFTLGRMSLCKRDGISEAKTMVSVILEIILSLLAALVLLGIAVLLVPRSLVPTTVYVLFALTPLCLVAVYPPVLNWGLRVVLGWLKRPVFRLNVSYWQVLTVTGLYLADWTLQGIGSFLLVNSFYPLSIDKLPVMLGGYAISWMIGFLMLIAPAGLGIREGIFTLILKMVMPQPVAIISVLLTRVWMTITETVMALACLPFVSRRRKNGEEAQTPVT